MITVGEIISKVNFEDVFVEYKKHYEEEHQLKIMDIFYKLKETNPCPNYYNMVLFIIAIKENESGEDVVIEHFDCDDRKVFFDVSGKDDNYEGIYSIASSPYEDLLGYYISDETITKFNSAQIVSHILWALDW